MKKVIYLSMIVALFAAACSSNKSGFSTKRKYTKGYYLSHAGKAGKPSEHKQVANTSEIKRSVAEVADPAITNTQANSPVLQANAMNTSAPMQLISPVRPVKIDATQTELLQKSEVKPSAAQKLAARQAVKKIKKSQKGGDLDNNTILLIILSLFPILALIAMYLHDGKKITLNFWVDLLLHFTVIGYLIFALLVVLDVVDLA